MTYLFHASHNHVGLRVYWSTHPKCRKYKQKLLVINKQKLNLFLCHFTLLKSCSLLKQTLVLNRTHTLKSWLLNMLMSPMNHKGYLYIEGSLTIRFVLPRTLSVNDVSVFLSLNMRNLSDNARIFSDKDWSVSLTVRMLHLLLWFGILMVLFGYVSIT